MVVLKLNMSSSRGHRQKLQKVADAVFVEGQSWKKFNCWSKMNKNLDFSKKILMPTLKQIIFAYILGPNMSTNRLWREKLQKVADVVFMKGERLIKMGFWVIKWPKFSIFPKKKIGVHSSKEFLLSFQDLICLLSGCEEKSCRCGICER